MVTISIIFFMRVKFIFTSLLILCITISCSLYEGESNFKEVQAIEYEDNLVSDEHSFENITTFLNPGDIVNVSDEYIIISDADPSGFIKVFSIPDLEFLYAWGEQGRGPHEFQFIPLNEINTNGNHLILYEIGTRVLREYKVNDTTLVPVNETSLQYNGQTNPLTGITKVKEDFYIADEGVNVDSSNHRFIALKPGQDEPHFSFGNYPDTELTGYEKKFEFLNTTNSSEDGERVAAFYFYHNRFEIYDHQGNLLRDIRINDESINFTNREPLDFFQYRSIKTASDDFLYLMAMHENQDKIDENIETFRTSFEKWDWDGNPVNRAMFDVPIHNFVVSEKHKKIYAYSVLDLHTIFEFDIP